MLTLPQVGVESSPDDALVGRPGQRGREKGAREEGGRREGGKARFRGQRAHGRKTRPRERVKNARKDKVDNDTI